MTEASTPRGILLNEARSLIEGDRNKTYGSPTENFQNTADLWTVLLGHKLKEGERVHPHEVATLMIALKLARTMADAKRDNFVDMAGYSACGWEVLFETSEDDKTRGPEFDFLGPLWRGSYSSPEPPDHVKVLRRTNGKPSDELLYRRNGGTWSWATRSDFTDTEWERFMNNDLGFHWVNACNLNYDFEEVR